MMKNVVIAMATVAAMSLGVASASANDYVLEHDNTLRLHDLNAGVASSMALGMPQMDSNGGLQLSLSGANYQNTSAGAVSLGTSLNERVFVNGAVSYDSRDNVAAGLSVTFTLTE